MKKCDFCKPAVVLGILVLLLCTTLTLFILSEIFGYKNIKEFIETNGSLLAGILGFSGVFIMIGNQNANTNKLVKEELNKVRGERFEINREKALEQLFLLNRKFRVKRQIGAVLKNGGEIITHENFSLDYFEGINTDLHYLGTYIDRCEGSEYLKKVISMSKAYFLLLQESLYYTDHGDEDVIWIYGMTLEGKLEDLKKIAERRKIKVHPMGFLL